MKKTRDYIIAPSILSADFRVLSQQIETAEAGGGDWIHIDIMDGHFVPNMSMGRLAVEATRKTTNLPLDVHLMVNDPERFITIFHDAGADHIFVQIEATQQIHKLLQDIQSLGCKAGVVLNPGTPSIIIEPILPVIDLVLVMTVNPGYGGQTFIPQTLPKISKIRKELDRLNPTASIAVDGGISTETLPQVIDAGANVFIAGNSIFNHPDGIIAGIQALKNLLPV
jgi:ribulose-phosphate 3-epimerase